MKYVIIGNSAAGIGTVEGIRQVDKLGEIVIITNEPYYTYSRPLISYLLLGKTTEEQMKYRGNSFYTDNHCTLINGTVTEVSAKTKAVSLSDGSRISFDKLLIATGSLAFVPPFDGLDRVEPKFTFMSLDDAKKLSNALDPSKHVMIVGAGLIGLKCAEGILEKVASVTVLDLAPRILSSILDYDSAKLVQSHLESKGISFMLSCSIKRFEHNTAILENNSEIPFDVLVLAVGVRPNIDFLKGSVQIDRGIIINGKTETSTPDIYAAGDCTQTLDVSSGQNKIMALLPNAYMQGECAGINMAGGEKSFDKAIPMNAVGFFGLHIITAGSYNGEVYTENKNGNYKRLFYSGNKLNGYILVGNVEKAGIYTSLIREQTPLDSIDFALVCEKPGLMAFTKEIRMVKLGGGK
ncbi:MAG: FAD-dependent oxidoreductase [Candidatus Bathyarchaeota archaeon]|nr:FAD-dependent oxidoreductase [Candidatus Termiticorpusculum sp.]MCL1971309.1 FAD-dependent oxidoreductase [Candidatus Termiticorpusculum sp.]